MKHAFSIFTDASLIRQAGDRFLLLHTSDVHGSALGQEGANGPLYTVGSVRLDNADELKAQMEDDANALTSLDSVIQSAYQRWNDMCVDHLQGDYAFGLWDDSKGELFCARDRLGIRPLYYHRNSEGLWFSNNLRVLLSSVGYLPEVNKKRAMQFLQGIESESSLTFFEGVFRLPASHSLRYSTSGEPAVKRYWHLGQDIPAVGDNLDENVERFRELFIGSVRKRLPSSGPVAIELSGGHDSSAICASAVRFDKTRLKTYSAVFPSNAECDESEFIDSVVEEAGVHNVSVNTDTLSVTDFYDQSILAHGDCHHAANIRIVMRIQELASADSCSVILNGVDGDNVASHGLYRLAELATQGDWETFIREVKAVADIYEAFDDEPEVGLYNKFGKAILKEKTDRALSIESIKAVFLLSKHFGLNRKSMVKQYLVKPTLRRWGLLKTPNKKTTQAPAWQGRYSEDELTQSFIAESDHVNFSKAHYNSIKSIRTEREAQMFALGNGVLEAYFEYTHSISEKYGVETRYPFMDVELMDFCLGLPANHKLDNGWTRLILRASMKGIYPEKIRTRRGKSNLAASIGNAVTGQCFADLKSAALDADEEIWQYFKPASVVSMIERHDALENDPLLAQKSRRKSGQSGASGAG
ncbi:asparagine synthase-related protein [Halomonas sp. E19]|uniref:asparagine synthase-related protein n=1 Tax=Halomonas sp. E19 TaxID=3397247 RepID=UPI0040348BC7